MGVALTLFTWSKVEIRIQFTKQCLTEVLLVLIREAELFQATL